MGGFHSKDHARLLELDFLIREAHDAYLALLLAWQQERVAGVADGPGTSQERCLEAAIRHCSLMKERTDIDLRLAGIDPRDLYAPETPASKPRPGGAQGTHAEAASIDGPSAPPGGGSSQAGSSTGTWLGAAGRGATRAVPSVGIDDVRAPLLEHQVSCDLVFTLNPIHMWVGSSAEGLPTDRILVTSNVAG